MDKLSLKIQRNFIEHAKFYVIIIIIFLGYTYNIKKNMAMFYNES